MYRLKPRTRIKMIATIGIFCTLSLAIPSKADAVSKEGTVIGYISGIPHRGKLKLREGTSKKTLDKGGVNHYTGTSYPGQPGRSVFACHNVTSPRPCHYTQEFRKGDIVKIRYQDRNWFYKFDHNTKVKASNTSILDSSGSLSMIIIRCYPDYSSRYRLVSYFSFVGNKNP